MDAQTQQAVAAMWSDGDYGRIGELLEPAADAIAERLGTGEGRPAIDIATGTGSVALRLARLGWQTTAVDISHTLLDQGERSARREGLSIEWREAPFEELPWTEGTFEAAASSFGLIFAADPSAAIAGVARSLKSAGRLVFTAWAPHGYMAEMTEIMMRHLPGTPSTEGQFSWGSPQEVTDLLDQDFTEIETAARTLPWRFPSAAAAVDLYFTASPAHRAAARAAGDRAEKMKAALADHLAASALRDGRIDLEVDYLLVTAVRC